MIPPYPGSSIGLCTPEGGGTADSQFTLISTLSLLILPLRSALAQYRTRPHSRPALSTPYSGAVGTRPTRCGESFELCDLDAYAISHALDGGQPGPSLLRSDCIGRYEPCRYEPVLMSSVRIVVHLTLPCELYVRRLLAASAPLPSRTNVYSGGLPGNPRIASAGRADWV